MMRAAGPVGVLLLSAAAAGCAIGRTAEDSAVARSPEGIRVTITTGTTEVRSAELLAVQDSALLVRLAHDVIAAVPFSAIRTVESHGLGTAGLRRDVADPIGRKRWSAVARFPQGLSPELLAQLLAARAQAEVEVVR